MAYGGLPLEIWGEIAKVSLGTYVSLECTCSAFKSAAIKESFIRVVVDGDKHQYLLGGQYRHSVDDQPACIQYNSDGNYITRVWYKHGKIHRDNDLPAVIIYDLHGRQCNRIWAQNGDYHRDNDQPAIICLAGYKAWYRHGRYHRDNDHPAVIYPDGTKEYYRDGMVQNITLKECSKEHSQLNT